MYEKLPVDLLKILTGTKLERSNTLLLPTKEKHKNYTVRLTIPKNCFINDLVRIVTRGTRALRIYIIS